MGLLQLKHQVRKNGKSAAALLTVVLAGAVCFGGCGGRGTKERVDQAAEKTAAYVLEQTPAPTVSSIGGEWAVIGLKKHGQEVPKGYYESYYDNVRAAVKAGKGVLNTTYYTDYARVTLALCEIGKNPEQVEGYCLTAPLDTYEKIADQGMNAAAFALIASQVSEVKLEQEDAYIQLILDTFAQQNVLENEDAVDIVAMGLEALSFYQDRPEVKAAVEQGINMLSRFQQEDGSFGNCESTAEVIMALTQLGISVQTDERFIKEKANLYDGLMIFQGTNGGFYHVLDIKENNAMATEKALLAMEAILLQEQGRVFYE